MSGFSVLVQELQRGRVLLCPQGSWVSLGREDGNDLVCKDKHVSRQHCKLEALAGGSLRVVDLSSFGTSLRGEPVDVQGIAEPGDELLLGETFRLRVVGEFDPERSVGQGENPKPPVRVAGRYLLLEQVGSGGAGLVYQAYDEQEGRRVAFKWLRAGGRGDEETLTRFRREAELQSRLRDYPGVVTIFDLGIVTGSGDMFCVLEYVEGDTLLDRMRRGIDRMSAVRLVARVARAVEYAHKQGVIHRDLKPANVLITREGTVRLTDFGISRALDCGGNVTSTGMMLGTPGYMAPEQILESKTAAEPADVYALGALLYSLLTRKLPVSGKTLGEALARISEGKRPPSPSEYVSDLNPELEEICLRALEFKPAERWGGAGAYAEALEAWLRTHDPAAPVSLKNPLRSP